MHLSLSSPNTTWQFQFIDQCLNDDNKSHECIFSFALCHPLPVQTGCNDSSVCQVSNGHNSTELGKFTINPFRVKENEQGFLAVFEKTEPILNPITNVSCKLTFVMEFDCNKDVPWIRQGLVNLTPTPLEYSPILGENCEVNNDISIKLFTITYNKYYNNLIVNRKKGLFVVLNLI